MTFHYCSQPHAHRAIDDKTKAPDSTCGRSTSASAAAFVLGCCFDPRPFTLHGHCVANGTLQFHSIRPSHSLRGFKLSETKTNCGRHTSLVRAESLARRGEIFIDAHRISDKSRKTLTSVYMKAQKKLKDLQNLRSLNVAGLDCSRFDSFPRFVMSSFSFFLLLFGRSGKKKLSFSPLLRVFSSP